METINALLNVNIFTSWKIVGGWIPQVDLFALGATNQSVELGKVKKQNTGTLRWKIRMLKYMLIIK
jgi:hypothetical protein